MYRLQCESEPNHLAGEPSILSLTKCRERSFSTRGLNKHNYIKIVLAVLLA